MVYLEYLFFLLGRLFFYRLGLFFFIFIFGGRDFRFFLAVHRFFLGGFLLGLRFRFRLKLLFRLYDFRFGLWCLYGFGFRHRFGFRLRFGFLSQGNGYSLLGIFQAFQVNLAYRLEFGQIVSRHDGFGFFRRFLLRSVFVRGSAGSGFVTFFVVLPLLTEAFRFNFKVFVRTEFFLEHLELLVRNLRVGVCLHGKSFLLQEFDGGRDSHIQVSCYFV